MISFSQNYTTRAAIPIELERSQLHIEWTGYYVTATSIPPTSTVRPTVFPTALPTSSPEPHYEVQEAIPYLAYVIEGEAPYGLCSWSDRLAIAHIYQRNSTMYGYKYPSDESIEIANTWWMYDDPSYGAVYIFSTADLQQTRVQNLIVGLTKTYTGACGLHGYR